MRNTIFVSNATDIGHTLSSLRVEFIEKVRDKGIKNFYIHYHNPCSDGIAALYSTINGLKFLFDHDYTITPIAAKYGTDPDMNYGQDSCLIIVDFSYKPHLVNSADVGLVVMLDHHETAVRQYKSFDGELDDDCIVVINEDNSMSGAGLAWRFFNRETIPHLIAAIEKRDLWDKNFLFVQESYLFTNKYNRVSDFDVWDRVISSRETTVQALSEFTPLVEREQEICKTIASKAVIKDIHSLWVKGKYICPITGSVGPIDLSSDPTRNPSVKIAIVNCHGMFASDVGSVLSKDNSIAIMFAVEAPDLVKLSLRCDPKSTAPLLPITGLYSGGGHPTAAGCVMTMNEFISFYQLNFEDRPYKVTETVASQSQQSLLAKIKKWIFKN